MAKIVIFSQIKQNIVEKITKIKDRLLQFAKSQGIKKEDFYRQIDIDGANFRGKNANSEFSSDKIVNILRKFPQLSSDWVLLGKGDMLRTDRHQSINGDNNKVAGNNLSYNENTDLQSLLSIIDKQSTQIDRLLSIIETTNKQKK